MKWNVRVSGLDLGAVEFSSISKVNRVETPEHHVYETRRLYPSLFCFKVANRPWPRSVNKNNTSYPLRKFHEYGYTLYALEYFTSGEFFC